MKLKRFHKDIYFPDWFKNSIVNFTEKLSGKQLICSYHATRKYRYFSRIYKRVIRNLIASVDLELSKELIFEFYANKNNEIKKVCYRFPTGDELPLDIILVISAAGKIVTIFLDNDFDPQILKNSTLYEKGEIENVI